MLRAYCFVDGAYLRCQAKNYGKPFVDPRSLADRVVYSRMVQTWQMEAVAGSHSGIAKDDLRLNTGLARVVYYDARPDDQSSTSLQGQTAARNASLIDAQVFAADTAGNEINDIAVIESGTARFGVLLSPDVSHVA